MWLSLGLAEKHVHPLYKWFLISMLAIYVPGKAFTF